MSINIKAFVLITCIVLISLFTTVGVNAGIAPTVVSVSPNNGDYPDGAIPVTITGDNFIQDNVTVSAIEVSGSGVTVGSFTVVNTTTITTTFTIASGATAGARNVSVTVDGQTGTGTGIFTINEYMTIGLTPIDLGMMAVGIAATDNIAATVTTNVASWTIDATDNNAGAGTGYMLKSGTPLTNTFKIGKTASPNTQASSTVSYTQAEGTSLPFYVSQTVDAADSPGEYTITIKFIGTY